MWIIDAVTKTDKYITGYTSNTRFGKRSTLGGRIVADIDGKYNYHIGNDYNTPQRTKLYIPCDIEVLRIVNQENGNGYGYQLFLYMIDYDKTLHLAHLNEIADIKEGQKLKEGTFVAYSGGANGTAGAGTSTGPHLHLGIANGRKTDTLKGRYGDGTWINPSEFKLSEKPSPKPKPKPSGLKVGDSVSYEGNVYKDSNGKGKGAKVKGTFKVTILNDNAYGVHIDKLGWVKQSDVKLVSETPQEKPFKPYKFKIKKGTYLYDAKGSRYTKPTTKEHQVTILEENRNLNQGLFKASWLIDVKEAWVKLS